MPRTIDLNADLGEGFPWDDALLDLVTSASVCCGAHAGNRDTAGQTLRIARHRGVVVGAHPGYADREHFGRLDQSLAGPDLARLIATQVNWLQLLAEDEGGEVAFVKPHGALYNQAQRQSEIARTLAQVLAPLRLPVLGQSGGQVELAALDHQIPFIAEGFADRRYQADGRLVPRSDPHAIIEDPNETRQQILWLVARGVQTICIHGDDPRSVDLAHLVLATLKAAGIEARSFA